MNSGPWEVRLAFSRSAASFQILAAGGAGVAGAAGAAGLAGFQSAWAKYPATPSTFCQFNA